MARKGITKAEVMAKALVLIEEVGYEKFSMHELAAALGIKTASLYNHIRGLEEVKTEIAIIAANTLNEVLKEAIGEKTKDEAFMAAVSAYKNFAMEKHELYKSLIQMPMSDDEKIVHVAFMSFAPLRELIRSYGKSEEFTLNYIRALRSQMHGFVELCNLGFMQRGHIDREESYRIIMENYLEILKKG